MLCTFYFPGFNVHLLRTEVLKGTVPSPGDCLIEPISQRLSCLESRGQSRKSQERPQQGSIQWESGAMANWG